MQPARISHIDVWRFVAIAMVLVGHLFAFSHPWYKAHVPDLVTWFQANGTMGVRIFFVISGFVICRGMINETATTGSISIRAFFIRRAYRILPALAVYIGFVALASMAGLYDSTPVQFASAALFTCNVFPLNGCGRALGHTWSLAFEEQFYLIFPFLVVLLGLVSKRHRLLWILAAMASLIALVASTGHHLFVIHVITSFSYMLVGCACALYWDKLSPALERLPVGVWLLSVASVAGVNALGLSTEVTDYLYPFVLPPIIALAVLGTPMRHIGVARVFSQPALIHLGRISYSVYLWQQLATYDYGYASPLLPYGLVLGTLVFAHLSYTYFELPIIKKGAALCKRINASRKASGVLHEPLAVEPADSKLV